MKKIGLALSGGGFRATLYHLGLVRFLRDADILSQVTHITSVSGGSIMAAHLALNWDRYTGSTKDFDQAASQLLAGLRVRVHTASKVAEVDASGVKLANGIFLPAELVVWAAGAFDRYVVDGLVNATGWIAGQMGLFLRYLQTGREENYLLLIFLSVVVIVLVRFVR